MTSSIAELRASGMTIDTAEAVAIAQQLIANLRDQPDANEAHPPYGPPSAENVFLNDDGSVVCRGCGATPAISEVAIFLDSLLPAAPQRIPGGLRYTIARALLDVEAPPFDSLDEFSRDLGRHAQGAPADLVRGVLARSSSRRSKLAGVALADRRRPRPAFSSALRRDLREADARLYEQQHRTVIPEPKPEAHQRHGSTGTAAAACLAVGLVLIGTGEIMHQRRSVPIASPTAPLFAPTAAVPSQAVPVAPRTSAPLPPPGPTREQPAVDTSRGLRAARVVPDRPGVEVERGVIAVRDVPSRPSRASHPVARASAKHVSRLTTVGAEPQSASRPGSRTVLDRLRLGWLRRAFTAHSDL